MTDKELAETLKYSSPKELYIVTWNNLLKRLFCPFEVLVKHDVGKLKEGERVWVEGIKVTVNLITVYIINGQAYYYNHFEILDPE